MAKCFTVICPCCGEKIKIRGKNVVFEDVYALFYNKKQEKQDVSKYGIEFGSSESEGR